MTHTLTAPKLLVSALAFASISFAVDPHQATPPGQQSSNLQIVNNCRAHRVRVDQEADWRSYAVLHFMPAVYEPANPQHILKPQQVRRVPRGGGFAWSRALTWMRA